MRSTPRPRRSSRISSGSTGKRQPRRWTASRGSIAACSGSARSPSAEAGSRSTTTTATTPPRSIRRSGRCAPPSDRNGWCVSSSRTSTAARGSSWRSSPRVSPRQEAATAPSALRVQDPGDSWAPDPTARRESRLERHPEVVARDLEPRRHQEVEGRRLRPRLADRQPPHARDARSNRQPLD